MYTNIVNPANYQLQGFGQSGMRTISTSQAYVEGEYYRVLVATQDSTISATSVIGDNITDLQVYAGTTIYGLFTAVSVSLGEVTAYLAGATDIENVWKYIEEYGYANGAIIEGADCAKDAISPLLDKYYAQASLVLVPSLYKTSVVYAERPLDANGQLTFTRASGATRVGPNGYVEKVRTNLLLQSNQFDTTWQNARSSETSGQSGYDGSSNAWLLSDTVSVNNDHIIYTPNTHSGVVTYSVYAKANTLNWFELSSYSGGTTINSFFDLENGAIGSGTNIEAKIEAVGTDGWYRCSVTGYTTTNNYVRIALATDDNTTNWVGTNGENSIYIQNAQLETGDIATDYIPTTTTAVSVGPVNNLPRLNYPINADGSVGCPSLLLEPQRTNLTAQSEDFNGWANKVDVTTTANYAVSPDGYTNADRLQFTGNGYLYGVTGFIQTSGTVYTLSCYAKRNGSGTQSIGFFVDGSGGVNSAWTLTSNWQRFTYTYTAGNNSLVGIAAASGADVSVYGFQFEANASYASSYIPTLSTSVTRVADAASKTGISSLIGQTEGTVMVEYDQSLIGQSATRRIFALNDGTSANRITAYISSTNKIDFYVRNSSGDLFYETAASYGNTKGVHKIAAAYKDGDYAVYFDGVQILSGAGTAGTIPACSRFDLGNQLGANDLYEPMMQALLFKTRLTNQQLQELTSL